MHHLIERSAVVVTLAALLAACGGGGASSGAATAQAQATQSQVLAAVPANKLPTCPAAPGSLVDITTVQGPGATSPLEGQQVTVRGIVTADFRGSGQLGGLYIQQATPDNDPLTSEGLFIYTGGSVPTPLPAGTYVQASGTVTEFRRAEGDEPLTQLAGSPTLEVCGTAPAIKPTTLTLPLKSADEFERTEGMLVRFQQPLYVSDTYSLGRYGELVLSPQSRLYTPYNHPTLDPQAARELNALSRLVLDDAINTQDPAPTPYLSAADSTGTRRSGDVVKGLEGILTMDFEAWRLQPTQAPAFEPRNPRPAAPAAVGGTLRVAHLNVLNYFTTLGQRGANTAAELQRQQAKIVEAVVGLDADVLGLLEIENSHAFAIKTLVDAVNARLGAPVYGYRSPGIVGTDEITVAAIYKAARVQPIGNPQLPSDPDFVVDGGLRPPVAQRFATVGQGAGFWYVINHLKSKGSCPSSASSPDAEGGQGCWNVARTRQAQALARWVASLVAATGESDVLMAGDFNAYMNEDPLAALKAAGHEDLLGRLPAEGRYSYVFGGESGALDHAFASPSLAGQVTGVAVWHTNADEPTVLDYNLEFKTDDRYAPTPYRASDHDPVVVGLALSADAPAQAATLSADLPAAGSATQAVAIENLLAQPVPGATGASLVVDWGDGQTESLGLGATRVEHTYASAGTYTVWLRLTQDGSLPAVLTAPVTMAAPPVVAQPGLFISEYIEGSSFNKAVELYNPGTAAVDLSHYTLRLYSNGAATPSQSLALSGQLQPGATYVLCHPSIAAAALPSCQLTNATVINYNGDDALTLEHDGVVVDQFGQVGFDPGTAWVSGTLSTLDRTLRRRAAVTQGSVPPAAPAAWDLGAEWEGFPNNTFDGLGSR